MLVSANNISAEPIYRCFDEKGQDFFTNQRTDNCHIFMQAPELSDKKVKTEERLIQELLNQPYTKSVQPQTLNNDNSSWLYGIGLNKFYDKLAHLQRGEVPHVTVFHVGDSHVRSEAFPRRFAMHLQTQFGASNGLVCYPSNVSTSSKKLRASKIKSASSKKKKSDVSKRKRRYILPPNPAYDRMSKSIRSSSFTQSSINIYHPQIPNDQNNAVNISNSITANNSSFEICNPIAQVNNPDSKGIRYYSYANSGKTFAWFSIYSEFTKKLVEYKPDLIIVTLGTNDAFGKLEYSAVLKSIESFVAVIQVNSPKSTILFTTPPDSYFRNGQHNPYISVTRNAIIDYASSKGYSAWDFTNAMGGDGSMNSWLKNGLARQDRIHLSERGSILKADMLFKDIIDGFNKYNKLRSR